MSHVFGSEGSRSLARLAGLKLLVAFDFDGTLAPVVTDRDSAGMRLQTRSLVTSVCALYPCAVISGRSRGDVLARVEGIGVRHVIGNHGLEPSLRMPEFEQRTTQAFEALSHLLAPHDHIEIEQKRYTLSIHYRRSKHRREACRTILEAVAALPPGMRVVPGKLVVSLVPDDAPNKGDALLYLMGLEQVDAALFVGDDITDEDVFQLDPRDRVLSIRVGPSKASLASYFLRDQREVDRFLEMLIGLRDGPGHHRVPIPRHDDVTSP